MSDSRRNDELMEQTAKGVARSTSETHEDREGVTADSASVRVFCEQIRKDAQGEIETILGKAELSARRRREEAQNEAETIAKQVRNEAETQARRIEATVMSGVSLEVKKINLRTRGEIVDEVFARVWSRLAALKKSPEYSRFLKELTAQGVIALGVLECTVAPGTEDAELFAEKFLEEAAGLARQRMGVNVKLTWKDDVVIQGSGVRIYSADGAMLFDNTTLARMERLSDELKGIIAAEVFGPDAATGGGKIP